VRAACTLEPVDHSYPRILLGSRLRCGQAFHSDEVVVEILKNNASRATSENKPDRSSTGRNEVTVKRSGLSRSDLDSACPLEE
jgi:hypothetical protein